MTDFTLNAYHDLLVALKQHGYETLTMQQYVDQQKTSKESNRKIVVLRHDVDLRADRSLDFAKLENSLGMRATYYFRVIPQSNKPHIISEIVELGHEIGYHYEDMSICDGNIDNALHHFEEHLEYFRQFYDVKTICMHGAPTSRYDGRDLWKKYDYHNYGIICEPYFDIDYSTTFYLTDTGRCWDGYKVSVRDKIPVYQDLWIAQGLVYHCTADIIQAIEHDTLPHSLIITSHPQRWTNNPLGWIKELVMQKAKNIVKQAIIKKQKK